MIFNYLLALGLSLSPVAFAQAPASDVVDMETAQKEQEKKDKKEKEAAANSVATEVPAPSKNYKNVEKLEVTGSYIKRIDLDAVCSGRSFQPVGHGAVPVYLVRAGLG